MNLSIPFTKKLTVPFDEIVAQLSIEEQAAIEQLTQELMAEYMTL